MLSGTKTVIGVLLFVCVGAVLLIQHGELPYFDNIKQHVLSLNIGSTREQVAQHNSNEISFKTPEADFHNTNTAARSADIELRFKLRREHLQKACRDPGVSSHTRKIHPSVTYNPKDAMFDRLKYCPIAKCGTTFFKWILPEQLEKWKLTHIGEINKGWHRAQKKFVFVREPYSRLVSAFFDKVLLRPDWWPGFGRKIMVAAGRLNKSSEWFENCSAHATFPDFINYFIKSEESHVARNNHFIPIHDHCRLCKTNYTFIGHLETFKEDLEYILKSANIDLTVYSNTTRTIKDKVIRNLQNNKEFTDKCVDKLTLMTSLWRSFHARAIIPRDVPLPLSVSDIETVTWSQFLKLANGAYMTSKGRFNRTAQKKLIMAQMFRQLSLSTRKKLRDIFTVDFMMHNYDPEPIEVFP